METRPKVGVGDLLWWVYYVSVGLTAMFAGPGGRGLIGLAGASSLAWLADLWLTRNHAFARPGRPERRLLWGVFGVYLLLELGAAGALVLRSEATMGTIFFTLAVFSALALATIRRRAPADLALVSQLGLHALMAFPIVAGFLWVGTASRHEIQADPRGYMNAFSNVASGIVMVFLPLVVICAVMASFVEHVTGRTRETRCWQVLLVGQIAWVILAARAISGSAS